MATIAQTSNAGIMKMSSITIHGKIFPILSGVVAFKDSEADIADKFQLSCDRNSWKFYNIANAKDDYMAIIEAFYKQYISRDAHNKGLDNDSNTGEARTDTKKDAVGEGQEEPTISVSEKTTKDINPQNIEIPVGVETRLNLETGEIEVLPAKMDDEMVKVLKELENGSTQSHQSPKRGRKALPKS